MGERGIEGEGGCWWWWALKSSRAWATGVRGTGRDRVVGMGVRLNKGTLTVGSATVSQQTRKYGIVKVKQGYPAEIRG